MAPIVIVQSLGSKVLAVFLREVRGYESVEFTSADDAKAYCDDARNPVAAVITGVMMDAGMNGVAFAHHIAQTRPGTGILIHSAVSLRPTDLPAGAGYLGKPMKVVEFLAAVDRLVQ